MGKLIETEIIFYDEFGQIKMNRFEFMLKPDTGIQDPENGTTMVLIDGQPYNINMPFEKVKDLKKGL